MGYSTDTKTYTDNPLLDEICYNCKKILNGIVVKNDVLANNSETANSIQNAEVLYIMREDGYVSFSLFPFTEEILSAFGYSPSQIDAYLLDKYNIPESDRTALTNFANQYFKDNFEEENNYYRMLNGLPPYNSGEEYFVYISKKDLPVKYDKPVDFNLPLHLQPNDVISLLYNTGVIDELRTKYVGSKYSYLNFLGPKRIDIYTARKANKWDILYMPNVYYLVEDKFTEFYKKNRELYHTAYYQEVYADTGEFYDQIMIVMLIAETFANMVTDTPEWYIKRDIFDIRSVKYFLESYGVQFFKEIPLKYQIRIVKNINKLIKFKSSNRNLEDIVDMITTSDNVKIIKYWLFKSRVTKKSQRFNPKPQPVDPTDPTLDYDFNILSDGTEDNGNYNYGDVDLQDETATVDIDGEELPDEYVPPVDPDDEDGYINPTDPHDKYDLEFISSELNDSYDNYIKDRINRTPYDDITYQDKYWDGEDNHQYIKNSIKDQDFTIAGTKYMSIEYKTSLSEYIFQVQYFLGMILDSKIDVNDIVISVPTIDENVEFSISNLFLYLIILSDSYDRLDSEDDMLRVRRPDKTGEGSEPTINEEFYDWKKRNIPEIFVPKYGRVHAFNPSFDYDTMVANVKNGNQKRHSHYIFGASYDNLDYDNPGADYPITDDQYAERASKALDDLAINDFRRPPAKYEDLNDIIDDYKHNRKCYEVLINKIKECDNEDDFATLAYVYQEMYTREFDSDFYKLSNGNPANDLLEMLLDRDYVLYDHYYTIMRESNLETRRDQIRSILNDIVETLEYYISVEGLEYLFSFTPIDSFYNIVYYIWLMIGFFKSYKVHFLDPYMTLVVDNTMDPLDATIPTQDTISGWKNSYWKWDKTYASDNLSVTPSFCMDDESKFVEEAMDLYHYKDYDPMEDADYDCLDAEQGEAEGYKDLNGGVANDAANYPFEDIDAGTSYLTMKNINDVDGGNADEGYNDYTDIDGGSAYILADEKKDWGGSQGFNFELDGGSSSPFFFKSRTIQIDIRSQEIFMTITPSPREDNAIELRENGVYIRNFLISKDEYDRVVQQIYDMIEDIRVNGLDTAEDIMSIDSFGVVANRISGIIYSTLYNMKKDLDDLYYGKFAQRIKQVADEDTVYVTNRYAGVNPYGWENLGGYGQ